MVLNAPYTQKCDIWSLGIIIFELLFGTYLFINKVTFLI